VQATVILKIVVLESGAVGEIEVLRGHPLFDAPAIAAVRRWRFRPARLDGRPISVFRIIRIPFRLEGLTGQRNKEKG